jgi:gliding motility-associated-like protein
VKNFKHHLLFIFAFVLVLNTNQSKAQCIQLIDAAGDTSSSPTYVNCLIGATPANVSLSFINVNALGTSTINWGDGTAVQNFASINAGQVLNHVYPATIDTYLITITQTAPVLCVIQAHFVNERSVIAQIAPLTGSVTTICAPNAIQFVNKSTNVSETTIFTLDFGDGTPVDTFDHTNAGDTISHIYQRNRVACNTIVTLTARNRCTGSVVSTNTYGPIQVYDLDSAVINANKTVLCYPDTTVTFTNNTVRNCLADGNVQQRLERWIIPNYFGAGLDFSTAWSPWPPSTPRTFSFPGGPRPRTFTIMLLDSSFCGVDTAVRQISIIDPPNAFFTSIDTVCGGTNMTFTNASTVGMNYAWNFGNGNTSTATNPTQTFNNTGASIDSFNVRLIVTNPLGFACADTFIKKIYVLPRPTSNFSMNTVAGNINGCDSLIVNFADLSTNATQWEWDFENNGSFDFIGQNPPPQKFLQTRTIRLRVTSTDGCVHERTRVVNIFSTPAANFNVASVCVNQVASFTDASTQFPGNNITTRAWNFGDPASGVNNTSTQTNPNHTFNTPGLYNVRLIIQSQNGCPDTIVQQLNVQFPPTADFNPNITSGCSPLTITFNNASVNADPNFYTWKRGNINFSNQSSPSFTFTNNGTSNDTISIRLIAQTTFGCRDSITKTIVVFPNPIAGISANALPSCIPSPISFVNASTGAVSYAWDFDDGNTSVLPNPIHQFANNSTQIRVYNVRLVARSANNCTDTAILPVLVYPDQTFVINTNVDSGCSPLTVNFPSFPGVVSYQWDFGDAQSSSAAAPQHVYTNLSNTVIDYQCRGIFTNAFGCRDTVFKTIRVKPLPNALFSADNAFGCSPDTIIFTNSSASATRYTWYFGDGDTLNTFNNASVQHAYVNNGTAAQVFTVRLRAYNTNECFRDFSSTVTVYPRVNSTFSIDTVQCSPYISLADNRSLNGNKFYWFLNNSLIDSVQNKSFVISNTTTTDQYYDIKLRSISIFGCINDTVIRVRVLPQPNAAFATDVSAGCETLGINFNNQSTPGINYSWDFGDGETSNNAAPNFLKLYTNNTLIPLQRNITLAVSNTYGCVDTFRNSVTIYPRVSSSFIIDTVQCSPYTSIADNRSVNGNKYYWYQNNILVDSTLNRTFNITNNTGVDQFHDIRLLCVSAFGCIDDTTIRIRVLPEPNANFISDINAGCQPLNITFTNQSTAGINYTWDFGDGEVSNTNDITFTKTFTNVGVTPLERNVQLFVSNSFGCTDTFNRTITVYPFVEAGFNLSDTLACSPLRINAFNTSTNTISYAWFVDNSLVDTNANPTLNIVNATAVDRTAEIRLVATSAYGCSDQFTRIVRVLPRPTADFFISNAVIKFPLNTFNIVNQNIQAGFNYKWYFGDGDSSLIANPGTHSYFSPGDYSIMLIVYNASCSDTMVRVARIEPPTPVVSFIGGGQGCAPLTIEFQNNTLYADRYEWDFGDGFKSNEENPLHTYDVGGVYTVSLVGYGPGGQALDVHVDSVTVYGLPNAYFISQPRVVFIPSDPVVFFNLSENAIQYFWDFGDGFTSTEASPTHYYLEKGEYDITLIVRNEFGCMDTFVQRKAVKAESGGNVVVPNAFTPNPNGGSGGFINKGEYNNDVFYPVIEGAENYRLNIYNRWGELLFESNDINIGWDGYYRGELCKQDVYIWKVELFFSDGTKKVKTGDLLLLR